MVIGLMIHNRSARSNEEKRKSSWKRALTSRSSAAISFTDLARQEDRASSSQVVGWTNFDVWERPQHVECVDTISRVRRYYSDFWEQCAENSWGASRDNDDDDFHPELPEDLREAIEREYDELIPYKGRNLKGRPLHFALWVASLSDSNPLGTDGLEDVKVLLWAKAEPNSSATYFRRAEVVSLPALHIAAGLGCIPAMGMILDHTGNSLEEVNRFCFCGEREFYCALHDAVFNGKAKAAVWLLEQHADPSVKNMEGFSALHWLALRSMDEDQDVEEVVRCLIRSGASVEQNTEEGKIPLEMAVKPGSLFPKHLLYLLAPSYQALDGGRSLMNCSFFEDLALMSSHSGKAAQDFADRIATLPAASAKHKVIKDAQHENAVDCMASLLQMAPEAAAGMLGLLLAKPIQESPGHHSLSSRAILWGRTLQCTYQPDQRITRLGPRQDRVRWPEWKYNATLGHAPAWHSKLLKVPQEHQARSAKVFDVALQIWRMSFKAQHQREPRLWIDKYCIDQDNIEASLMCLPVFLASCHTLLILAGPTFLERLWCIEEVFVFLQMSRPIHAMEIMAICDDMESRVSTFDVKDAECSKEKDRQKMLATIEAGCESYEAFNKQVRGAMLQALKRAV